MGRHVAAVARLAGHLQCKYRPEAYTGSVLESRGPMLGAPPKNFGIWPETSGFQARDRWSHPRKGMVDFARGEPQARTPTPDPEPLARRLYGATNRHARSRPEPGLCAGDPQAPSGGSSAPGLPWRGRRSFRARQGRTSGVGSSSCSIDGRSLRPGKDAACFWPRCRRRGSESGRDCTLSTVELKISSTTIEAKAVRENCRAS